MDLGSEYEMDESIKLLGSAVVLIESMICLKSGHSFLTPTQRKNFIANMKAILKNGLKEDHYESDKLWNFILGLRVICPNFWPTRLFKPIEEDSESLISQWIDLSMRSSRLSNQLSKLTADSDRLSVWYEPNAFLRKPDHVEALTIAIQALEEHSPNLLAKINPILMATYHGQKIPNFNINSYVETKAKEASEKATRAIDDISSSTSLLTEDTESVCPSQDLEFAYTFSDEEKTSEILTSPQSTEVQLDSSESDNDDFKYIKPSQFLLSCYSRMQDRPVIKTEKSDTSQRDLIRSSTSLSSLSDHFVPPKVTRPKTHVRSNSDGASRVRISPGTKITLQDGSHSVMTGENGRTTCPEPGQGLMDFWNLSQLNNCSAQLDRENAHFMVAEAVLQAIERMKTQQRSQERRAPPTFYGESDEDFSTNDRLGPRRKLRKASAFKFIASDEPATTDHSPCHSSNSSLSANDTEADFSKDNENGRKSTDIDSEVDPTSAENVAISLLSNYNSELLAKASEQSWFVSERDVPQKLLPMPDTYETEESEEAIQFNTRIRGTMDWAPPRPQLILTLQKKGKRSVHLASQSWRCSGCGLKVSEHFSRCFRFCHYLGRYFCTSCHTKKTSFIPAKVIFKWDFKKYNVSNFSSQLLHCMQNDPLFNIASLNPALYKKSRTLKQIHLYRLQLYHAHLYIVACSRAIQEKTLMDKYPNHWVTDPHVYSMNDLISISKGELTSHIKSLTLSLISHIPNCEGCHGQGFICEICRKGDPIFPFQLDAVTQCTKCKSCYHFLCFAPNTTCPRCSRKEKRLQKVDTSDVSRFQSDSVANL